MTSPFPDALPRLPPRFTAIALAVLFTLGAGGDPLHQLGLLSNMPARGPGPGLGILLLIVGPLVTLSVLGVPIVWAAAVWPAATRALRGPLTLLSLWSLPGLLFFGPGTLHGLLYLAAFWSTATGLWARAWGGGRWRRLTGGAICLWSLVGLAAALAQIPGLVQRQPYCIARGGAGPAGLADLRGLAFFTSATGYKSTSHWYFNGVLLTPEAQWNWSARRLSFQPVTHPRRFTSNPRADCTPEPAWLSHHLF